MRIVDEIKLEVPPPRPNVVTVIGPINLALLVSIREGEPNRSYEVSITVHLPDGQISALTPGKRIAVGGAVAGGNFIANLSFAPQQEGMYLFDVNVDGTFMSRVPLHVTRREATATNA